MTQTFPLLITQHLPLCKQSKQGPPFKRFRSHFAQLQEPEDTTEGSFLSYTQLVIITAGRKLTGVFQLFFFFLRPAISNRGASLLWTLLCFAYVTVAKSRPVNTVTTPLGAKEAAGVAKQRRLCLPSLVAGDITDVFKRSQGIYIKSSI